jgi:hypothetical protein
VRTVVVIVVGLALLAVVYAVARRRSGLAARKGLAAFGVAWFMFAVVDMFVGVWRGYPLLDELLIHLLVFAVPVAAALALGRSTQR